MGPLKAVNGNFFITFDTAVLFEAQSIILNSSVDVWIFSGVLIGEIAGGRSRGLLSSVVSMAALFPVFGGSITGEADSMAVSTGGFERSEDSFGAPGGEEFLFLSRNFSFLRASLFRSLGDFRLRVRPGTRLAAPADLW